MESRWMVCKMAELVVALGLVGLILAWSTIAVGAGPKSDDSFAAGSRASQAQAETDVQTSDDAGAGGADTVFDGNAGSTLPFTDIPLAALFLAGVCVLGAGLGPHARRSHRGTKPDAAQPESHVGSEGRAPN
jgi:hypothetical protein